MHDKIQTFKLKAQLASATVRDPRAAGLLLFLVIVLLISWSGIKVIDTNYGLQKQISKLQQENNVQQLSNNNLKLQNEYYNTDTYLDLQARQSFGLAAPGEKLLIVPKSVALAHYKPTPATTPPKTSAAESKRPAYQRNFQAWMDFFLHRQSSE